MPSSRTRSNTQETFARDRWCHYEADQKLEECERQLEESKKKLQEVEEEKAKAHEEAQKEIELLKIRLFGAARSAKNYDEAEKLYHEVVTDKELSMSDDPKILDIRFSFAAMLVEQGKFEAAEPISRAVWDKRRDPSHDLSEAAKDSHRQLCSILCSLQRFDEAEGMHRNMYHKAWKDAWALENADEVCRVLAKQQHYEKAKTMQCDVWKERRKQLGQRNELTIQSGALAIEFLEKEIAFIGTKGGIGAQKMYDDHRRTALELEREVMLGDIWVTHACPESNIEVLNAGHDLGTIHFQRGEFEAAKMIFESVWEGRKIQCGEADVSALATGGMLGKALRFQGTRESIPRAIHILKGVWDARRSAPKSRPAETISSGEDLAQLYFSYADFPRAEPIYKWIVDQKSHNHGQTAPETLEARWCLAQILYKQGISKTREAQIVLRELYNHWKLSSPRSSMTSQCGCMLAHSLSADEEKSDEALDVIRDVYDRKIALGEKDLCCLDSGRMLASLLMRVKDLPEAEKVLGVSWNHEPKETEEARTRLACGILYGQCLHAQQKYCEAKEILESLAEAQTVELPAGDPQIAEAQELLGDINERMREIEDKKNQREHRNSRPAPRKRGSLWR